MTARTPGAIATLQLLGQTEPVLAALTGVEAWPVGRMRLVPLGEVDEGLAGRLGPKVAQVMPHGGPRVVQRVIMMLGRIGAELIEPRSAMPQELFPEAADHVEALALEALARAASPLAIDALLDQPRRWRALEAPLSGEDRARSERLNRLIDPPVVVVAGPANVGKSTLSNALLGRSMSIAIDEPGTTRDYTAGRIDLAGLVVDWHDTPGLRATTDAIEQKAQALAGRLIAAADLLVALTDHEHDWPELPRDPDLRVLNKIDVIEEIQGTSRASLPGRGVGGEGGDAWEIAGQRFDLQPGPDLAVSAVTGTGLAELVTTVRDMLVSPADVAHGGPWRFDARLDSATEPPPTR